jgi:hypothetical protein
VTVAGGKLLPPSTLLAAAEALAAVAALGLDLEFAFDFDFDWDFDFLPVVGAAVLAAALLAGLDPPTVITCTLGEAV